MSNLNDSFRYVPLPINANDRGVSALPIVMQDNDIKEILVYDKKTIHIELNDSTTYISTSLPELELLVQRTKEALLTKIIQEATDD